MRRESIRAVRPPLEGDRPRRHRRRGRRPRRLPGHVLELARQRCDVVLLEAGTIGSAAATASHLPTGPHEAFTHVVERLGRAAALAVWESGREGHHGLRDLARSLGGVEGHRARGGFLLATDRASGLALADSEDLLREDGFSSEFLDHYMPRGPLRRARGDGRAVDDRRRGDGPARALRGDRRRGRGARRAHPRGRGRALTGRVGGRLGGGDGARQRHRAPGHRDRGHGHPAPAARAGGALQEQAATRLSCSPGALQVPTPTQFLQGSLGSGRVRRPGRHRGDGQAGRGGAATLPAPGGRDADRRGARVPPAHGRRPAARGTGRDGPLRISCAHDAVGASLAALAARWTAAAALGAQDPTPEPFRAGRVLAGGALPQ